MYAERFKAAGVVVNRTLYTGVTHEFFGMGGAVAKARIAMRQGAASLASALLRNDWV